MKIVHILFCIVFLLNIGFTSTVNTEQQACAMHHQQVSDMNTHVVSSAPQSPHSCCDDVALAVQSCPDDCGHCQSHCSGMAMLQMMIAPNLDILAQEASNIYRIIYYVEPTEGWLIPPIFNS